MTFDRRNLPDPTTYFEAEGLKRTGGDWLGTVASVATVNVAAAQAAASNDATPQPLATIPSDPDRWCWPHSDAFTARVHRFTDKGLLPADAMAVRRGGKA
jgi:hypothetical protein